MDAPDAPDDIPDTVATTSSTTNTSTNPTSSHPYVGVAQSTVVHECVKPVGLLIWCAKCNQMVGHTTLDKMCKPMSLMGHVRHGLVFMALMSNDADKLEALTQE